MTKMTKQKPTLEELLACINDPNKKIELIIHSIYSGLTRNPKYITDAVEHYKSKKYGEEWSRYVDIARLLERAGMNNEAKEWRILAINYFEKRNDLNSAAGQARDAGMLEKSKEIAMKLINHIDNVEHNPYRAGSFAEMYDMNDKAKELFTKAMNNWKVHPSRCGEAAEAAKRAGLVAEARKLYAQAMTYEEENNHPLDAAIYAHCARLPQKAQIFFEKWRQQKQWDNETIKNVIYSLIGSNMWKQVRILGDQLRKDYEQQGRFRAAKEICEIVRDKKNAAIYKTLLDTIGEVVRNS